MYMYIHFWEMYTLGYRASLRLGDCSQHFFSGNLSSTSRQWKYRTISCWVASRDCHQPCLSDYVSATSPSTEPENVQKHWQSWPPKNHFVLQEYYLLSGIETACGMICMWLRRSQTKHARTRGVRRKAQALGSQLDSPSFGWCGGSQLWRRVLQRSCEQMHCFEPWSTETPTALRPHDIKPCIDPKECGHCPSKAARIRLTSHLLYSIFLSKRKKTEQETKRKVSR